MDVFDKVRKTDDSGIMGIVVETTDITTLSANSDMTTTTRTTVTKVKILVMPEMRVIHDYSDKWEIIPERD